MIQFSDIEEARQRIQSKIHKTPLMLSETLSEEVGASVYVKLESLQKTGAFKEDCVIAGQGTLGLEILDDLKDPNYFVSSIGGGSLIGANSLVFKKLSPRTQVIGLQTHGANAMHASLAQGSLVTLKEIKSKVESFATKQVSENTFQLVKEYVDQIHLLSDEECDRAALFMLERTHILLELSASICVAAILNRTFPYQQGDKIVLTLCGGNYDLNHLKALLESQ